MIPDEDEGNAMFYEELERDTLDALDRCKQAGARFDDLYFLAAQLGVGERWRKSNARPAHA